MRDRIIMSKKELIRKTVFDSVKIGGENLKGASLRLGLSYRQTRRSYKKYITQGDQGLIHKSRGLPSSRRKPADFKEKVINLYLEKYRDYGPTLAAEVLLEEDGIQVNPETLRLWLKAEGIWVHRRIRKKYRKQRKRKSFFGDLVQLDGSIHGWLFEQEGHQCLINMVDDATGKTMSVMSSGETTRGVFQVLDNWIKCHGIPRQVYVDLKSLYISPKLLKAQEGDEDPEWLTHFSKACKALGIAVIKAYSPQAKGRVERNHAVYQDRFVKALKRKNIRTIEEANQLLYQGGFIEGLNTKFMKPPESSEDAHMPVPNSIDLNDILSWSYERTLRNDYTLSFENTIYQVIPTKECSASPKQKVCVRKHLNAEVSISIGDKKLKTKRIENYERPKEAKVKSAYTSAQRSSIARSNKTKSPWSRDMSQFFPKPQRANHDRSQRAQA